MLKFEINFEGDTDRECMTKYAQIIIGYPEGYIIMQENSPLFKTICLIKEGTDLS